MATFADLTVDGNDIAGIDFDKSRASATIEFGGDDGVIEAIVVDGTSFRLGSRREVPDANGIITFADLVTTNSADNPDVFYYRVRFTYVPKGSRKQGHDEWVSGWFPLTADDNLAAIPEAWDNVTAPVSWRSDFRDEMEALRSEAAAARDEAVDISGISTSDAVIASRISTPGTETQAALSGTYVSRPATVIKAYDYGVRAGTGTSQNTALAAAFQAAKDATGGATVELPPGVVTVSGSFPMAGYSAGLRGAGGSNTSGAGRTGTVIRCINQTGAVLDFTGYLWPADQIGRIVFEGFTIEGDGTTSATKVKRGIYSPVPTNPLGLDYPNCYTLRDITIRRCGGAGIEMSDPYFGLWENVVLCDPVGVVANDVPYAKVTRGNGTVYINVGLRSQVYETGGFGTHPGDVGGSGAFILDGGDDIDHVYTRGVMLGCWAENLHVPSGGTIVSSKTMSVSHRDWSFFDCFKVNGGTGTSFIRFPSLPPGPTGLDRQGGNLVSGIIEGQTGYHDSLPNVWIDHGVRDSQGGNYIDGTKGWGGKNVLLDAGVQYTTVMLMGAERAGTTTGWIDNSGNDTNTLIDASLGVWQLGVGPGASIKIPGVPSVRKYLSGRYYGAHPQGHSTGANGTGVAMLVPFWVSANFTANRIGVEVITAAAASTVRLGIYGSNTDDQPGALLLDAGTVDSTTTGVKEVTISQALRPGLYWLGAVNQGGNPTLRTIGTGSLSPVATTDMTAGAVNCYYATGVTGALPTTWASFTAGMQGYRVMLRAA